MSEYKNTVRSSYFFVTDVEKLKDIVSEWGDKVYVYPKDRTAPAGETPVMFGGYGMELPTDDAGFAELQAIMPENEVCIIMEVGSDKLKYLLAGATIITNREIKSTDLTYNAIATAQAMVNDQDRYIQVAH